MRLDMSAHPVMPTARPQPVDAAAAFVRVELVGVFQIGHTPQGGFLRHPALVPNVPVPAALVGRHDDPQPFRRGAFRRLSQGRPARCRST